MTSPTEDPAGVELDRRPFAKGLVQVYTGDGKGKTTAALGLALRAAGHGLRVYFGQFMKGVPYGELGALAQLPIITVKQFGSDRWTHRDEVTLEDRAMARAGLQACAEALHSGKYEVVVLDEVNVAVAWGLLPVDRVVELVSTKPVRVELILTGRYAPPRILETADLVTEMGNVKHPFSLGLTSRQGIEF